MNSRINFMLPEWYRRRTMKNELQHKVNLYNFGLDSKRRLFETNIMVNDVIGNAIFCGKVKTKTGIDHFTKKGLVLTDGGKVEADTIIYA
ncbi:hypothetical protein, partial [Salmonella sp. s55004]|uniref:hypothetical protein n=1 Tax=Salmonella sp. s55004 TaxID=3159675 RepID=UPI00397FF5A0